MPLDLRCSYSRCAAKPSHRASRTLHSVLGSCRDDPAVTSTNSHLCEAGDGLAPAEGFLDQLAFALADGIALVPCRAAVDGRDLDLLRDVRRDALLSQIGDEVGDVVALVGAE